MLLSQRDLQNLKTPADLVKPKTPAVNMIRYSKMRGKSTVIHNSTT
jgi:hypothetical protein